MNQGSYFTTMAARQDLFVYIGAYTASSPVGITLASLDASTGNLRLLETHEGLHNPTFLALNKKFDRLYSVCETDEHEGKKGGAVAAFAIEPRTGALELLNLQPTHGASPCHLSLDLTGDLLFAANYASGSISVFPVEKDGKIGAICDLHQHHGSGPSASRQQGPHAHSIYPDWNNRFALSVDLGIDKIVVYMIDNEARKLVPSAEASLHPGAGPRHLAFLPKVNLVYVINELDSTITAMRFDPETGRLAPFQTIPTLPADFHSENWCAEIVISPDGRFLYASNRGHDSIAVFGVDPQNGNLALIEHSPTLGRNPRNFVLSPGGEFLIAANQDSDTVKVFSRDAATGRLTFTGHSLSVSKPVCVRVLPLKNG